uniref:Uncharacterized protein n=1 Tax=Arundo donax TaxID=35708 RepID=A0A0A9CE52_ARUDO
MLSLSVYLMSVGILLEWFRMVARYRIAVEGFFLELALILGDLMGCAHIFSYLSERATLPLLSCDVTHAWGVALTALHQKDCSVPHILG